MTTSDQVLWDLMRTGRYSDALAMSERIQPKEGNYLNAATRGTIYLCLERFSEAVAAFEEAQALSDVHGSAYLQNIGTAQWLAGNQEAAARTWQRAVQGILSGAISFADAAGGVSQGLLLFYAGISMHRPELTGEANKYLANRAKRKRIENWPSPLALLVLGHKEAQQVLRDYLSERERSSREMDVNPGRPDLQIQQQLRAKKLMDEFASSGSLEVVARAAVGDVLLRRHFLELLFYWGVTKRAKGEETECLELMKACASLDNPLVEDEWYLARKEVAHRQ